MQHNTDGGPAFPSDISTQDKQIGLHPGMSLRDYFASKALEGLIAKGMNDGKQWDNGYIDGVAMIAYDYADAMLKARAAKSPAETQAQHLAEWDAQVKGEGR